MPQTNETTIPFEEVPAAEYPTPQPFHYKELTAAIALLKEIYNVPADRPLPGGFSGLMRRLSQKLFRWYVHPVVAGQNVVNSHIVHALEELEAMAANYEAIAAMGIRLDVTVHKQLQKPLEAVLQSNHELIAQNAQLEERLTALEATLATLKTEEKPS